MNLDYADYIKVNLGNSKTANHFLIDSQADVSIIKLNSLTENQTIGKSEIIQIFGVIKTPIESLGFIYAQINLGKVTITHKLHIIPNEFNIPSDGMMGKDFIKLYECVLDY